MFAQPSKIFLRFSFVRRIAFYLIFEFLTRLQHPLQAESTGGALVGKRN